MAKEDECARSREAFSLERQAGASCFAWSALFAEERERGNSKGNSLFRFDRLIKRSLHLSQPTLSPSLQVPAPRPAGPPGAGKNKKKNKSKAQRKAEQQSREGKKLEKEATAEVERRRRDPNDPNNTLILNYSRWEGDKRTQLDGKQAATKRT